MSNFYSLLKKQERSLGKKSSYRKGETIFLEDSLCLFFTIVIKGSVKIVSTNFSGNEIIYNEIQEGGCFGNNLLFSSNPYYRGDVIAKSDCEIISFTKESILKIMSSNSSFLESVLIFEGNFAKKLNFKIKLLAYHSAEERLLFYLYSNSKIVYFESIKSLAETLYLSRETLSRLVHKLESKKIIKIDKKHKKISIVSYN